MGAKKAGNRRAVDPIIDWDELQASLRPTGNSPEDGWYSAREIRKHLGWGTTKCHRMLQQGVEAGRLACERQIRMTVVGEATRLPCYKILPDKGK